MGSMNPRAAPPSTLACRIMEATPSLQPLHIQASVSMAVEESSQAPSRLQWHSRTRMR